MERKTMNRLLQNLVASDVYDANMRFVAGTYEGNPFSLDPSTISIGSTGTDHMLITGTEDKVKSYLIDFLDINGKLYENKEIFYIVDPRSVIIPADYNSHGSVVTHYASEEPCMRALRDVANTVVKRYESISGSSKYMFSAKNIFMWNTIVDALRKMNMEDIPKYRNLFYIITDMSHFDTFNPDNRKEAFLCLEKIVRYGRSTGVHLIMCGSKCGDSVFTKYITDAAKTGINFGIEGADAVEIYGKVMRSSIPENHAFVMRLGNSFDYTYVKTF